MLSIHSSYGLVNSQVILSSISPWFIGFNGLVQGKIYRKTPYLMVETHGFPVNFPLNQSIDGLVLGKFFPEPPMILVKTPWLSSPIKAWSSHDGMTQNTHRKPIAAIYGKRSEKAIEITWNHHFEQVNQLFFLKHVVFSIAMLNYQRVNPSIHINIYKLSLHIL